MKTLRLLPFLLLLLAVGPRSGTSETPVIRIESSVVSDPDQKVFQNELSLVARKAAKLGSMRFSKIKKINDSYQLTAEAIRMLAERGDVKGATPLLRKASKDYDGNRMAHLLLGSVMERLGDRVASARAYAAFYRYSLTTVPFERKLIGSSSLRIFRGYIEKRFVEWKMRLPESRVGLALRKARAVAMLERSRAGQWINLVLPLLVVVGLGLILLAHMKHVEFPAPVAYFLISTYVLLVLGYLLWAAHFFMGLPFLGSIEKEYSRFFGGGALVIVLLYVLNHFLDPRREPKIKDTSHCPHCGAIVLSVSVECPSCKRKCRD